LVHQAVLKLTHAETKEVNYFIAKSANSRLHSAVVDFSFHKEKFGNHSGSYDMSLVIGDPYIEKSFIWKFGEADIQFEGTQKRVHVDPFAIKPEIQHKFRKAEIQAEPIWTQLFCALLLLPLVFFIIQGLRYSNFSNFPTGTTSLYALVFISAVGLLQLIDVFYWVQLRFLDALYYLVLVGQHLLYNNKYVH